MQIVITIETIEDLELFKNAFTGIKSNLEKVSSEIKIESEPADMELWKQIQTQINKVDEILTQVNQAI